MKIEYGYLFGLPKKIVWKYLKDAKFLQNTLPGCKSFVETAKGVYKAELMMTMGPIQDTLTLEIHLNEARAPSSYQLNVKGNGNVGEMIGNAILTLKENQGRTQLICLTDVEVTGALALAGQRLLESGANKGLNIFFPKVENEIKKRLYLIKMKQREKK